MTDTFHAAIIGIDRYPRFFPNAQLSGCVNDALAVFDFLVTRMSVPRGNIRLHLSPESPSAIAHVPTNILSGDGSSIRGTFDELLGAAKPGAHIVIYYAGHGVRVDRPNTNERIYGFAPADTAFDGPGFANLIVDRELNALLRSLTERGASVTVIADTCHSANSTRGVPGKTATVRRLVPPALSDAQWRALVEAHPALVLSAEPRATSRGAVAGNGWFDGSDKERAWVVLAACLDRETAKEDDLDGVPHGLFTACLLRELRKVPREAVANLQWKDIYADVRRAVMERAPALRGGDQTPVLEGRPESTVFGGNWRPFEPGFAVQRAITGGDVALDGGVIDGLDEGAEIGIYPPDTTSFHEAEQAGVAPLRARIVSATPAKSTARLLVETGTPIAQGSRARLIKPGPNQRPIGARLTDVPPEIVSALAGDPEVARFVELNPAQGAIDIEVRPWSKKIPAWTEDDAELPAWVGTSGGWVIAPHTPLNVELTEDDVIAYLPRPDAPGVDDGAKGIAASLGRALVHYARFLHVLRAAHVDQALAGYIDVGLRKGDKGAATFTQLAPGPSGEYVVEQGEPIWVELRAKQAPPARLFFAFLACSNDGNTMLQWPTTGGSPTLAEIDKNEGLAEGQTVRVGEDRFEPARPTIRKDQTSSRYTFKVIAAVVPGGEAPPALKGLLLPTTAQNEVVLGAQRGTRGGLGKRAKLTQDAWCTWDLPVRVRRT